MSRMKKEWWCCHPCLPKSSLPWGLRIDIGLWGVRGLLQGARTDHGAGRCLPRGVIRPKQRSLLVKLFSHLNLCSMRSRDAGSVSVLGPARAWDGELTP